MTLAIFLLARSGDDLLPLADAWKHQLPGCEFASPDAPTHSDFGQGYQWFSVVGVTEQNRLRRRRRFYCCTEGKMTSFPLAKVRWPPGC
ncbi:MAG: hypothetical protein ACMX3H_07510 [Sodalis sp. (in: enterobacteria)]|uniref:hypothetical protein n=1 Tax=Sodalis sp. (in: enterobacteria) TaxID=1898979 RepID=UPI0039E671F0